jgi:drug/metabolite transporter (DMT)-like permease
VGWGSTQSLGKIATATGHQPFGLIFWQLVVGAVVLGAISAVRGKGLVFNRAALRFYVVIAFIGTIIPNATFYAAVVHLPAGVMSILISTVPLIAFPMALVLGIDRFSPMRALGLGLGILGVALIAAPGGAADQPVVAGGGDDRAGLLCHRGDLCGQDGHGRDGCLAGDVRRVGRGRGDRGPHRSGSRAMGGPVAPGQGRGGDGAAPAVHGLVYAAYVWLAGRAGSVFASQCAYLVTGSGVIWAMVLLGERFQPVVWVALAVMLAGVALVQPRPARRA